MLVFNPKRLDVSDFVPKEDSIYVDEANISYVYAEGSKTFRWDVPVESISTDPTREERYKTNLSPEGFQIMVKILFEIMKSMKKKEMDTSHVEHYLELVIRHSCVYVKIHAGDIPSEGESCCLRILFKLARTEKGSRPYFSMIGTIA